MANQFSILAKKTVGTCPGNLPGVNTDLQGQKMFRKT